MRHLIVAITLLSGSILAQASASPEEVSTSSSPANGPSYSQTYCAGFVTRRSIPRTNFVAGSKESPHEDRFPGRSLLFLGGPALVEGQRYSLLRQLDDPNREDSSPEQRKRLAKLGALYQDVGWVTVHSVGKGSAIASFDFACDAAIPGDIVVPYQEKPRVAFRIKDPSIDAFVPRSDTVKGHILGAKEFDGLLGPGQIIYTDFGKGKGAQPGDYLMIVRGYAPDDLNEIDRASESLPKGAESSAIHQAPLKANADKRLPQRVVGEMLVLSLNSDSSTALITRAFSEMELGDTVESEGAPEEVQAKIAPEKYPPGCRPVPRLMRMFYLARKCEPISTETEAEK
jgi:hypothetical protein